MFACRSRISRPWWAHANRASCLLSLLPAILIAIASPAHAGARPNVVFILIDDLGWSDVGYNGSEIYETPAIDALAASGMRFTNAYAAGPMCRPSRFAIMTGKFPARNVEHTVHGYMHPDEFTLAEAFREAGYRTFFAGKWHLGIAPNYPERQGFEINIGGHQKGAPASHFYPYGTKGEIKKVPGLEATGEPGEYLADRLTDETEKFIRMHARERREEPFFVYLSHYAVHRPLEGPRDETAYYRKKIAAHSFEQEGWRKLRTTHEKLRQDNPDFAAMVANVDRSVGRVLSLLDELRLDRETIVVFASDNGGDSTKTRRRGKSTSNQPLKAGKSWMYEGGIRVPLIVRMKGVTKPGSVSDSNVTGTDFYPTLLELAGLTARPEQHLDGVSFVGSLKGEPTTRPAMFWEYDGEFFRKLTGDVSGAAMLEGRFKLIRWKGEEEYELFDVKNDPGELRELSHEMPEKRRTMIEALSRWEREMERARSHQPPGR